VEKLQRRTPLQIWKNYRSLFAFSPLKGWWY
jgi:hypothetical protein